MHSRTLWTLYNVSYLLARGVSNTELCNKQSQTAFSSQQSRKFVAHVLHEPWFHYQAGFAPGHTSLVGSGWYGAGISISLVLKLLQHVLLPQVHTWLVVISGWFCLRPYQPGRVVANSIDTIVDTRCRPIFQSTLIMSCKQIKVDLVEISLCDEIQLPCLVDQCRIGITVFLIPEWSWYQGSHASFLPIGNGMCRGTNWQDMGMV